MPGNNGLPEDSLNNTDPGLPDEKVNAIGGRRKRKNGSRKNSWLAHVKATMKVNRNMSFKQVLKRAKQTYKRSKSQSQSSQNGGRRRRGVKRGGNSQQQQQQEQKQQQQQGGSGMAGKAPFGESAAPVA